MAYAKPEQLDYGAPAGKSIYMEYIRRTEPFSMDSQHWHPYYEIYLLLEGKRTYFIKDAAHPVEAGDLILIGRHELHKSIQSGTEPHARLVMHFDEPMLQALPEPDAELLRTPFALRTPLVRLPAEGQRIVRGHAARIVQELRSRAPGCDLYLRHALTDMLLLCARHVADHPQAAAEPPPATPMHGKVSDIVRYLNEHYATPVHIHELAARFYISPYYLSRIFKEVTGFTIIDYVNLTRLKEAQRLLRDTPLKITDIAGQVGFGNFSHFGKMFKAVTRMSARDYRRLHQGDGDER